MSPEHYRLSPAHHVDPTGLTYHDSASFGEVVRRVRLGRSMTLDELAEVSGVAKAALSTIENGITDPRISTAVKLAEGLRLPLHNLLGHACGQCEDWHERRRSA